MTLVYTYSSVFGHDQQLIDCYKASYKCNSRLYKIKLYCDSRALVHFEDTFDDIRVVDIRDIVLMDDLKYKIFPTLPTDHVLCDGDVFLYEKIKCSGDITYDQLVDSSQKHYQPIKDLISLGVQDLVHYFRSGIPVAPNIGILWFKDPVHRASFIGDYFLMRDWYLHSSYFFDDIRSSAILGQYLLGCYAEENSMELFGLHEKFSYIHLSGDMKKLVDVNNFIQKEVI